MNLFRNEEMVSHANLTLKFKIECDALTDEDIETLATIIARNHPFRAVYGVPRGGIRLARALEKWCSETGKALIVDDVLTTGRSMEEMRAAIGDDVQGIVIFARGECPPWITPLFQLSSWAGP